MQATHEEGMCGKGSAYLAIGKGFDLVGYVFPTLHHLLGPIWKILCKSSFAEDLLP